MTESETILEFNQVSLGTLDDYAVSLSNINFRLAAGELALVKAEDPERGLPFSDLAQGLVAPEQGVVSFLDRDWMAMTPDEAAQGRGRIGRFFDRAAWISNLDVDENITLAQRHHSNRALPEIEEEMERLAEAVGLKGLPRSRPAWVSRTDLRLAQWVRAFLGQPRLLLLDFPTEGFSDRQTERLQELLAQARSRGAAVIWITSENRIWTRESARARFRFEVSGAELTEAGQNT